jgi:predicted transcriptional regulator of viral defense system
VTRHILTRSSLRELGTDAFFRARDLEALGLTFRDLRRLLKEGQVERVTKGLYRLRTAEPTPHHTLAAVSTRVPQAIVCLLSALRVHEIGTQLPQEVWIAIPHKARAPRLPEVPIRVVRFSGPSLRYGIQEVRFEGVPARVTSPARTVVDCFRFRRLVGRDAAEEALREALRDRKATTDEVWRAAEVCRARSLVRPYLEAASR